MNSNSISVDPNLLTQALVAAALMTSGRSDGPQPPRSSNDDERQGV